MRRIILTCAFLGLAGLNANAADIAASNTLPFAGYIKLMGGAGLPNNLEFDHTDYDLKRGWAAGGTLGMRTSVEGLAVEADIMRSVSEYAAYPDDFLNSTTVIGNLVYSKDMAETVSLYGGLGAGWLFLDYNDVNPEGDGKGSSAAYQVFGGMEFALTDKVSLTAETRYQSAFSDIKLQDGAFKNTMSEFHRTLVLGGVVFNF